MLAPAADDILVFCNAWRDEAGAVVIAQRHPRAFVLTTDFSDFSAYRVPFASPEGAFYN